MADLLGDSDSDSNSEFKINTNYAEKYNTWRGKEELQKFTDRYGEAALANLNDSDDESSTSTEEDEDAKELTPQVEKQFFKTLSCLKKKDPKIYDVNTKFFEKKELPDTQDDAVSQKKKKEKKMFLRDYERKMLLEKGGQVSSDEESEIEREHSPTFVQEQKAIKQSFKAVLNDSSDEDAEDKESFGGLLKPRQKTNEEKAKDEEEYREWLKGHKKELSNQEDTKDLDHLKNYWSNPKLEQSEAFLRDYILNKRYLESEDKEYIPTYEELVHDSDEGGLSGDEKTIEEMEQFEHKYNFRFEEPDQEFVKRYPRTTQSSLRRQDERRRLHREEVRQRKIQEKEAKKQQLHQLKAIKRKEIAERLEKLKQITGNTNIAFHDEDLNEDFDPEKHDQRMKNLFDSEYYDEQADEEKPEFPDLDDELELENWDQYKPEADVGNDYYEPHCEDPDFNMDCEYDPRAELKKEMLAAQSGRKKKKNRRHSKLAELLAKKKPKFDPQQQEVDKYIDEHYNLDFEDILGDQPCRFKYRDVVSNSYGLTFEEILLADDKELNRWCSLKKTAQYRSEQQELYDVQAYHKKAKLEALKRRILPSLFKTANDDNPDEVPNNRKKKKKVSSNNNDGYKIGESEENKKFGKRPHEEDAESTSPKKKKKSPKKPAVESVENTEATATKRNSPPESVPDSADISKQDSKKKKKPRSVQKQLDLNKSDDTILVKQEVSNGNVTQKVENQETPENRKRKNKKKKNKFKGNNTDHSLQKGFDKSGNKQPDAVPALSDARLKAYGINPKKFKNKLKYGKKT